MNKWEVDEHEQSSEKVRSRRFCPPLLNKNRNCEGIWSNKRKSFVKPVGINSSNFKNETLFVSFTAIIKTRNGWNGTNVYVGNRVVSSTKMSHNKLYIDMWLYIEYILIRDIYIYIYIYIYIHSKKSWWNFTKNWWNFNQIQCCYGTHTILVIFTRISWWIPSNHNSGKYSQEAVMNFPGYFAPVSWLNSPIFPR